MPILRFIFLLSGERQSRFILRLSTSLRLKEMWFPIQKCYWYLTNNKSHLIKPHDANYFLKIPQPPTVAGGGQEGCQMEANVPESLMLFFGKMMCQSSILVEGNLGRSKNNFLVFQGWVVIQSFLNCARAERWVIVSVWSLTRAVRRSKGRVAVKAGHRSLVFVLALGHQLIVLSAATALRRGVGAATVISSMTHYIK